MTRKPWIVALSLAATLVGTTGCATKKYVKQETGAVNSRVDDVQGQKRALPMNSCGHRAPRGPSQVHDFESFIAAAATGLGALAIA